MIIECINCFKKFDVNSDLIPSNGRTIQCGVCNHTWFYKKGDENQIKYKKPNISKNIDISTEKIAIKKKHKSQSTNKGSEIVKYIPKSNFTFGKFLSYIIVTIISFIAILVIIDTFKTPLYNYFPNLEFLIFSLYETLKDIELFIRDLI